MEDKVEIRLLDKSFHVKCPSDHRAQLQEAGRYLDRRMREVRDRGRVIGVERIAVMTALNLAYEALNDSGSKAVPQEVVERLERLQDKISDTLNTEQQLAFDAAEV